MKLPIWGKVAPAVSHAPPGSDFSVALVLPPYGSALVANLALALLSAGIKARGVPCRCFYWNLDVMEALDAPDPLQRVARYERLADRPARPFNEWAFARPLYDGEMRERDQDTWKLLQQCLVRRQEGDESAGFVDDVIRLRERAPELIAAMVERLQSFSLVGISSTFFSNIPALALARAIKRRWPQKIVVLGGANCDGEMGRALMEKFPQLDYAFSGEVDQAFPEFVARLSRGDPIDETPGMHRRLADGQIISGPPARPTEALDELPLPDYDDYVRERQRVGLEALPRILALEASRGCWWGARQHCTFCGLNANGMAYRQKRPERFQAEVTTIVEKYRTRRLFMADNILSMDYYGSFMDWARRSDLAVSYFFEIKANLRREQVAKLSDAGITSVQPGIESFSSQVLALMRKGITGIQNIAFLKYARDYGVACTYNILIGFPGEEAEEYRRMAREMAKLRHLQPPSLFSVEFHRFSPYHSDPAAFAIRLRPSPSYRSLYPFPDEEIARIAYMFVRDDEPADPPYAQEMREEVAAWQAGFQVDRCSLVWRDEGASILVRDRRPGWTPADYRLGGFAAALFRAIDGPKKLQSLIKEAQSAGTGCDQAAPVAGVGEVLIAFTREEFARDSERWVQRLVDAGIVYAEDDRLLALPVMEQLRPLGGGWSRPDS